MARAGLYHDRRCRSPHPSRSPNRSWPPCTSTITAWFPPSSRRQGTGAVLMMAWMNEESLRRSLETGRTWFWSRSRQEYWCKGETSGDRQYIRQAFYDCDGDTLLFVVEQEGAGRLPHRQPLLLLPGVRVRVLTGSARPMATPDRAGFHALAASYTVVPVWRELLADLITPVAAFARLCPDDQPGLPVGVGRARRALEPVVVRGPQPPRPPSCHGAGAWRSRATCPPTCRSTTASWPRSSSCWPPTGRRRSTSCRRCTAGSSGYLGYDVVREVEHLPDVAPDDATAPDAVLSVIGELAAFDHWRQRVTLIENVIVPPGAGTERARRALRRRLGPPGAAGPRRCQPARRSRWSTRPPPTTSCPRSPRPPPPGAYCQAVEVAKEHILAGDIFQVVLSQRFDFELGADPFDAYRVLRQVNPSPYMYFVRLPELTLIGCSPEPMVQLLDGRVISRPIAGTPPAGSHRGGGPPAGRRADRAPEGARRARHAGRPGPQRRGPGGELRDRAGRRDDDPRALQPRDAPDLAGVGRSWPRA